MSNNEEVLKKKTVYLWEDRCVDTLDGKLLDAIKVLQGLLESVPEEYRDDVRFEYTYGGEVDIYYNRYETDEEYTVRIAKETRSNNLKEERERKELARLIKTYGIPKEVI